MPSIGRMVLFFIVIKDIIQVLAWMIIFGKIKIRKEQKEFKKTGKEFILHLYDTDKLLKKESHFILYVVKLIYYETINLIITLYHSITRIHYAIFFSVLNLVKATPFFIHFYF